MRKEDLLAHLRSQVSTPETDPVKATVNALRESMQAEIGWNPRKTTTKEIWKRWLIEATEIQNTDRKAAFRLNLQPLAIDTGMVKFSFTRDGQKIMANIMYPNKDGNIGVRVSMPGANDQLEQIDTEEPGYINGLGYTIVKLADKMLEEKKVNSSMGGGSADLDTYSLGGASVGGYSPNWENNSTVWESDMGKISGLMALVEQDETDDLGDEPNADGGDAGGDVTPDDVNAEGGPADLGADAFSLDGGDMGMGGGGMDFGGGGGGGGFGGPSEGGDGGGPSEPDVDGEFVIFANFLKDPVGNGIRNGFGEGGNGLAQGLKTIITSLRTKELDGKLNQLEKNAVESAMNMADMKSYLVPKFLEAMKNTALGDTSREIPVEVANQIVDKIIDSPTEFISWFATEGKQLIDGNDAIDAMNTGEAFNDEFNMGGGQDDEMGGDLGGDMGGDASLDSLLGDIQMGDEKEPDEIAAEGEVTADIGPAQDEFPNA